MTTEPLYQLRLDDYATPAYISFNKPYYGTLEEIRAFVAVLEQDEESRKYHETLITAFHAYENGDFEAKHNVAYQEIPLLIPAKVSERRSTILPEHEWTHMNIWECPYELRCQELRVEQAWIEAEGRYARCVRARFKNLELQSIVNDDWRALNAGFWGYPHILEYEEPFVYNRLMVVEEIFKTKKLMLKNARLSEPGLVLDGVCDEMFGDG